MRTVGFRTAAPARRLMAIALSAVALLSGTPAAEAQTVVTKRFGEAATCDVKSVTTDAVINTSTNEGWSDGNVVYFRPPWNALVRFELSALPPGTTVRKAVLRMFYDYDYYDGGTNGVSAPLFRIDDPSGTGAWSATGLTPATKRTGVGWSAAGGISSALGPQIGSIYFKNWLEFGQSSVECDLTGAVQQWVAQPSSNLGFYMPSPPAFNKRIAASEHAEPLLRPYLEVSYDALLPDEIIPQPTALQVKHSDGQTFIAWQEATTGRNETSYRIYRSSLPITPLTMGSAELVDQVHQGSSWLNDVHAFRQPELSPVGIQLQERSGLYVYTARGDASAYYAVTTVVEGNENRLVVPGVNGSVLPVQEHLGLPRAFFVAANGAYTGLVVYLGNFNPADPADAYGFDNRKCAPFLFSVVQPLQYSNARSYPLTLFLHAWSQTYFGSEEGIDNSRFYDSDNYGGYTVGIDDNRRMVVRLASGELRDMGPYLETDAYGQSFYTGWNSNYIPGGYADGILKSFGVQQPFEGGKSVLYVEKSIRYVLEWMMRRSPWAGHIDSRRVYATGTSMGGCGALGFSLRNPDLIVAGNAQLARTAIFYNNDYSFNSHRMFGSRQMAIPTPSGTNIFDHLDLAKYLRANKGSQFPPIRMYNGKLDPTIPWTTHPDFYAAAQEAGVPLYARWDQGTHNAAETNAAFPEFIGDRYFPRDQNKPYYDPLSFRRDLSHPGFANLSLNSNPGDGNPASGAAEGGINRFVRWDSASVVDDLKHWQANLFLYDFAPQATATVTLFPVNTQSLILRPSQNYLWKVQRLSDNSTLQSGTAVLDGATAKLVIPGVQVTKTPTRFAIDRAPTGDSTAPSPPSNLTATALSGRSVRLDWTAATDANGIAGYRIFDWATWKGNSTGPSAFVQGLNPGQTCILFVKAFDPSGNESTASNAITITMPADQSNQPPVLTPIGSRSVGRGELVTVAVGGYDVDDFSLTYSADPLPVGSNFDAASRKFTWIPSFSQVGQHTVTFRVTDGKATTSENVTFTVRPEAPLPVIEGVETYGAFISGGVEIKLAHADGDELGRLFIRKAGDSDWRPAHPFVRYDANHLATSLFDLEMATNYELRVEVVDPEMGTIDRLTSVTTRAEWSMPPATRGVLVGTDAQLTAAVNAALPGDHILLQPGVYTAPVVFDHVSGTPGARIVLRSSDPARRALLRSGVKLLQSDCITLQGLELFGGGGIKVRGSQNAEIVGNLIREAGGTIDSYAIHLAHNELIGGADKDFRALILNNVLSDDENSNFTLSYGTYPDQTYYGIKQDDGVGGKTIIRGNVIRGFADGISPGGDEGEHPLLGPSDFNVRETWPNNNIDIHDNLIYGLSDDGIETDGHMINGRIFRNRIGSCVNSISTAPLYPGPYFILRNTLYGFREQAFKLNTAVEGVTRNIYFYHNTVVQRPGAAYCIYRGLPAMTDNVVLRNNILMAQRRIIDTDIGSNSPCSWFHKNHSYDNDLLWTELPNNGTQFVLKWGYTDYADNVRYTSFAEFKAGTADPAQLLICPDQRLIPQEPNGLFGNPNLNLAPVAGFDGASSYLYDITPGSGSPAIDRAVPIPGINDIFTGARPDIGAFELNGAPLPPTDLGTTGGGFLTGEPRIETIDSGSVPPGARVAIWGANFGSEPGAGGILFDNGLIPDVVLWSNNHIEFIAPHVAKAGLLRVIANGVTSNAVPFVVRTGAIYFVDNTAGNSSDGNPGTEFQPWRTLAQAARSVVPGDVVYISGGPYAEQLIPVRAGENGKPILFRGKGTSKPVLDGATLPGRLDGVLLWGAAAHYVDVSGIALRNFENGAHVYGGAANCRLIGIDASGCVNGALIANANAIGVANSNFEGNTANGVLIEEFANNISLTGCTASRNGEAGSLGVGFRGAYEAGAVSLKQCTANDNSLQGFAMEMGEGAVLEGCSARRNSVGFAFWGQASMTNCEAVDNSMTGLSLLTIPDYSATPSIVNCTIVGSGGAAMEIIEDVRPEIVNSISIGAVLLYETPLHPIFSHSLVLGSGLQPGDSEGIPLESVDDGSNAIDTTTPSQVFEDYAARKLELKANSPARRFSLGSEAPELDILLRERVDGIEAADAGAYEFSQIPNAAPAAWRLLR